jgi:hypothetical protein
MQGYDCGNEPDVVSKGLRPAVRERVPPGYPTLLQPSTYSGRSLELLHEPLSAPQSVTRILSVLSKRQGALQLIARLEAENARLRVENERLLEQFACWAYNAHTLPAVNRDQTVRPLKAVRSLAR